MRYLTPEENARKQEMYRNMSKKVLELTPENFGILAICSLRYCLKDSTADKVMDIIRPYLEDLPDNDLELMIKDVVYPKIGSLYKDGYSFDDYRSQSWLRCWQDFLNERERRNRQNENPKQQDD